MSAGCPLDSGDSHSRKQMHSFTKAFTLVCVLVVAGVGFAAEPESRFPSDTITPEEWEAYRAEILAKPGLERKDFANQIVIASTKERTVWVFTQPNHVAYPAVVVWAVVTMGTGSEIKRMGYYAGDQKAFDKWRHAFDGLDALVPNQIR
jgi:hypothetical protein